MKMKLCQLSLLERFVAVLALVTLLPSYSGAWLIDSALWDSGYSKLDWTGLDRLEIKALWYKADFVAETAYFRLDTGAPLGADHDAIFQIGIDKAVAENFVGDTSEVNNYIEDIGVDTVLSIDMFFPTHPKWMTVNGGTLSKVELTTLGGDFAYTDGVTEGIYEWSVPLDLLNDSAWITVYGTTGLGSIDGKSVSEMDFAGSLTVTTVPEPGTLAMAGVLAVLGGIRARLLRKQPQPSTT